MLTLHPQYIKDTAGKQLVVLPANEYNNLINELEELDDIKLYDEAKKRKQIFVDVDIAFNQIEIKRKNYV